MEMLGDCFQGRLTTSTYFPIVALSHVMIDSAPSIPAIKLSIWTRSIFSTGYSTEEAIVMVPISHWWDEPDAILLRILDQLSRRL